MLTYCTPGFHFIPKDLDSAIGSFYTPSIPEPITPFNPIQPERNLIASILSRAIEDAHGYAKADPHTRREAKQWLRSKLCKNTPFSFLWCCSILELDPEKLRQSLRENKYRFETPKRFRQKH